MPLNMAGNRKFAVLDLIAALLLPLVLLDCSG